MMLRREESLPIRNRVESLHLVSQRLNNPWLYLPFRVVAVENI